MTIAELFQKKRPTSPPQSVPVGAAAEAAWRRETTVSFSETTLWAEPEGELALDVYLTPDRVVVRTAVAGVRPDDLSIALHNDLLTIRGRRHDEAAVPPDGYVVQECHWGPFSRSVVLPVPVEPDGAEAVMKSGVLAIALRRALPTAVSVRLEADE